MRRTTWTILLPYAGAILFTALAVGLRGLIDSWLGDYLQFSTLCGAVALAAWSGGNRPALLATALGFLACDWPFADPRGSLEIANRRKVLDLGGYLLSGGVIIGLTAGRGEKNGTQSGTGIELAGRRS
jgi:K+-sensing histidine kinase KdpD